MGEGEIGKRLFLIDGNSLFYRSYYAIQRLSNSRGFPTNAIYGFITTLRKLIHKEQPEYLGVVFDVKGPTVRHEEYAEYKAHRKPMPDDLAVQLPVLKQVLHAMRIPTVEYQQYEADDVIATLAARASEKKIHTVVVTTDKDMLQILNKLVSLWNPSKEILVTAENAEEYFGVPPIQVVDVLSLWGDASDNVPGVPGVGEKTAKQLIKQFGSLESLLANLNLIKNPRLRTNIEQNIDLLKLSRSLVTVRNDLDLRFDFDCYRIDAPDEAELIRLFQELEFSSLLQDFIKTPATEETKQYEAVFSEEKLISLVERLKAVGQFSIDTETDNASPVIANLVGISFSPAPGEAFYLPLKHKYPGAPHQLPKNRALEILSPLLEDDQIKKTGQNIKYDWIVFFREGIELKGIDRDTMILSYLLEPNWGKHNLEKLALVYLQAMKIPYNEVVGQGKSQTTIDHVAIERVVPYACQDADFAGSLGRLLWEKVKDRGLDKVYHNIERPLIELLARMEIWGIRVDEAALKELSDTFEKELKCLEENIFELAGCSFNINSPQQLASILFNKLGLQPKKKTKATRSYSTSVDVLLDLAPFHPLARYVLEYRQISKLKSTYADALPALVNPETGRIHTSYNQTVAATGRLSSSDPNLQNIPVRGEWGVRFRQAFVPESGYKFLAADYSQIELRILAHLAEDPGLIETFYQGKDIHEETARLVFGELTGLPAEELRRRAKVINFSIIYGTSAFSLAKELGTSTGEAQRFIDRYFEKYSKVRDYLERVVAQTRENGYTETIFGRKRPVPELRHPDKNIQQAGRRIALNTPIQGSAADLIKLAMIKIWENFKRDDLRSRIILQVHDELLFEVPAGEEGRVETIVKQHMENVTSLRVPLKVKTGWGRNWAEAK